MIKVIKREKIKRLWKADHKKTVLCIIQVFL